MIHTCAAVQGSLAVSKRQSFRPAAAFIRNFNVFRITSPVKLMYYNISSQKNPFLKCNIDLPCVSRFILVSYKTLMRNSRDRYIRPLTKGANS